MADLVPDNHRSSTALEMVAWAAKILFLSIGIFSTLSITAKKLAYPYFLTLISSTSIHQFYSSALSNPPYLFLTVNFIIIVIWKLHDHSNYQRPDHHHHHHLLFSSNTTQSPSINISLNSTELMQNLPQSSSSSPEIIQSISSSNSAEIKKCCIDEMRDYDPEIETTSGAVDDHHRPWPPTSNPDEGIIKEKDLDATWTDIMNRRSSPSKNQAIKKSDTWEKSMKKQVPALARAGGPPVKEGGGEFVKSDTFREGRTTTEEDEEAVKKKEMRKSKMFRESTKESSTSSSSSSMSIGWRGRDVLVVSHDELFKKGEAFIKMNYDQMKLQNKESEQRRCCVEMMNAAVY